MGETKNIKAKAKPALKFSPEFKKGLSLGCEAAFYGWMEKRALEKRPVNIFGDPAKMIDEFMAETHFLLPFKVNPHYESIKHQVLIIISSSILRTVQNAKRKNNVPNNIPQQESGNNS